MTERKQIRTTKAPRRSDPRTLRRFIEEMSWLLNSFEDIDFKALAALASEPPINNSSRSGSKNRSTETINFLGRLPALFMDETLFPSNEDIVEFANHALNIEIPRWHKKSKYELIGHVVCNANLLNAQRLSKLSTAVEKIQDEISVTRDLVQIQRKSGISWNEVIQNMLSVG